MASLKASIFFKFRDSDPLKKTFYYPRKIEGFCKLLMLYFVLYFFGNAVFYSKCCIFVR
jgi:hypothetical protein